MGRGRPGTGVEALATSIRVSFTLNGKRCRETLHDLKPTHANMKYATRLVADVKKQIASGTFEYAAVFPGSAKVSSVGYTFKDFAAKWLGLHVAEHSTKITYRRSLGVWADKLGDKTIRAVTVEDIKSVIAADVARGISAKTINNNLDPLRSMFAYAVESGALASNPTTLIKRLPMRKAPPDPFSRDEMDRILDWMEQNAPVDVCAWYTVAFTTGLRPSEQCALKWDDLAGIELTVKRAFVRGKMKTTKTRKDRVILLNSLATRAFHEVLESHKYEYIFARPTGAIQTEISLRTMHQKYWVPCLMELGIRHRSPYHTRHTYATVNLMGGVNPAYIARQLGHSSLALLLSTYSRWIDGADGGAEHAKVEAAFAQ